MTPELSELNNEYLRQWRKKNPEGTKMKTKQFNYLLKEIGIFVAAIYVSAIGWGIIFAMVKLFK